MSLTWLEWPTWFQAMEWVFSSSSPFFCLFSSFGGMMLSRSLYKALTVEVMACRGVDMVEYIGS